MSAVVIRPVVSGDHAAIRSLVVEAFGQPGEADLVDRLRADGDVVLELVAEREGEIRGHVVFSRLDAGGHAAVALAPLSVAPAHQRTGLGAALVEDAHRRLAADGERLAVVLGEPDYYGRFGYRHEDAAGFDSEYQCDALQALVLGDGAPRSGRLVYARAFSAL